MNGMYGHDAHIFSPIWPTTEAIETLGTVETKPLTREDFETFHKELAEMLAVSDSVIDSVAITTFIDSFMTDQDAQGSPVLTDNEKREIVEVSYDFACKEDVIPEPYLADFIINAYRYKTYVPDELEGFIDWDAFVVNQLENYSYFQVKYAGDFYEYREAICE